jgi:hypothetical protein
MTKAEIFTLPGTGKTHVALTARVRGLISFPNGTSIENRPVRESIVKRISVLFLVLLCAGLGGNLLFGQFTAEEIAQRPEMEEFLRTAEIVRFEPAGEGVTKPYILYLKKDGVESKAVWKNPEGVMGGYLEGWQYEIAAYRLDKLIGLDMVPVAIERDFQGKPGALVLWAKNKFSLLQAAEEKLRMPASAVDRVEKAKYLARAWDSLIANEDRTQQNVLYTEDMRTILIDHSRAFRSTGIFTKKLMFGAHGIKTAADGTPWAIRRLPRSFFEKIKGLTFDSIQAAVGDMLTKKEIDAVLTRRDLLVKEINGLIRTEGEANVLYD